MEHEETGCQSPLEGPILCVNSCGFFGSPANMNMCSKCYKDTVFKQEQAKAAASSVEDIVNGSPPSAVVRSGSIELQAVIMARAIVSDQPSKSAEIVEPKSNEGDVNRCTACKKRVGLTAAFKCRCGDIFCGSHRYSDKHDCPFDYRTAGRDAIAKANPVVKAEKLDKI